MKKRKIENIGYSLAMVIIAIIFLVSIVKVFSKEEPCIMSCEENYRGTNDTACWTKTSKWVSLERIEDCKDYEYCENQILKLKG